MNGSELVFIPMEGHDTVSGKEYLSANRQVWGVQTVTPSKDAAQASSGTDQLCYSLLIAMGNLFCLEN